MNTFGNDTDDVTDWGQENIEQAARDQKYECDVRGRHENSAGSDPKYFVLLGPDYKGEPAVMCDTLNCHYMFDLDEQQAYMTRIADALNSVDVMRAALEAIRDASPWDTAYSSCQNKLAECHRIATAALNP